MINAFKRVNSGSYQEDDKQFLYPLMIWESGNYKNLPLCNFINKNFFTTNSKRLHYILTLGIDKSQYFIKYPKSRIEKDEKMEMLKPYIMKVYKLSESDYKKQFQILKLLYSDKKNIEELNSIVGFDKKECKSLDIEFKSFKVDKSTHKVKEKGLW